VGNGGIDEWRNQRLTWKHVEFCERIVEMMSSMMRYTDMDIDNDERVKNNGKGCKTEIRTEDTLGTKYFNSGKNGNTEVLRNGNLSNVSIDNSKSAFNRNGTHTKQLFYDDDSTTSTVVSLLEWSSSMAATTAVTLPSSSNIDASIQHRKSNGEAQQRPDVQNCWEGHTSTQGLRGERDEAVNEVQYRRQHHTLDTQIERSVQFLQHPSIVSLPSIEKELYLCSRGLSNDKIKIAKETATMRSHVNTPATNDIDTNNTDDDNDSDTINSDDYLDLLRTNITYCRTVKKDKNTTQGGGAHMPLPSLSRNSGVTDYNDRNLTETIKTERRRGIDIYIMQQPQPQPMSCIPSSQDKEGQDQYNINTRQLYPCNDDGCNRDCYQQCIRLIKDQIRLPLGLLSPPPDQLSCFPFTPRNVCRLLFIVAVLFGVVLVLILLFCQLKNGDDYFLFLPSTPTPATTVPNIIKHSIPKNIDNHLHAGIKEEKDRHPHICRTQKSMLETPFLAWELLCKDIDDANKTQEKDSKYKGYSSDKISHIKDISQHMEDIDKVCYDGSCRVGNRVVREGKSAFQSNIKKVRFSFQPHEFTKSIKNYSSLHGRLSTPPLTPKVKSKVGSRINLRNQGTAYQTIDGDIVHYPTEDTVHGGNGQIFLSDLEILEQLSEIKSTLDSVKGEITKHRCSNDIYNEESKRDSRAKFMYEKRVSGSCSGGSNVFNKLEEICTTVSAIESKLIITIKDRRMSNIGKNRCQSHSVLDLHKEKPCKQAGHHSEKSNTDEHRKALIPKFLKKTLQMLGRIITKIRVGLKLILQIP